MAVWNPKYKAEFYTSKPTCNYEIDILQKGYTGTTVQSIYLDPEIIQEWQDDDPKTPIRGCTLTIKIITDDPRPGNVNVPFETFYSNEDDTWKAILKRTDTNETLFVGYLLQDDCQDICIDYTHTYTLTFSDNLGLMKGVSLLQASEALPNTDTFSSITVQSIFGNPHKIFSYDDRWGILNIGNSFTIYSGGLAGTYLVIGRGYDSVFGYWVYTAEDVPIAYNVTDDIDYTYYGQGITGYQSLKNIFQMLIYASGIRIPLNVMTKLVPVGGTNDDLLRDTFIDVNTFLKDGEWMNCYDILEMFCIRFNACFFQAHGQWYFVRWDELYRYTTSAGATYQGNAYNADMNVSTITKNIVVFDFLAGKDMETGTMRSIIRPDLFVKETFNYEENILLKNENLQELGEILNQYEIGTDTIYEYGLPYWTFYSGNTINPVNKFIRVIKDIDNIEIDRFIVLTEPAAQTYPYLALQSNDIFVSAGDKIAFSFDFKTKDAINGFAFFMTGVVLTNGIDSYYLDKNGIWQTFVAYDNLPQYLIQSGDDSSEWHTFNINSYTMPIEGKLNVYLFTPTYYAPTYDEIYFKNLNFSITTFLAGWGNIIGHTHNTEQYITVKKNYDKQIFIDTSPRRTIRGSLFLDTYTGFIINRTTQWHYPGGLGDTYQNLGQGITQEALFTSYIPRYKFEGNLLFVNDDDDMLTPFSVFNLKVADNQFRFIPGKLTINYHANQAEITLHEFIRNEAGITGDQRYQYLNEFLPSKTYNFNYLYENK